MVLIQGIHTVDHIENETIAMCLKPVVACVVRFFLDYKLEYLKKNQKLYTALLRKIFKRLN